MSAVNQLVAVVSAGLRRRSKGSIAGILLVLTLASAALAAGASIGSGGRGRFDQLATDAKRGDITFWGMPTALRMAAKDDRVLAAGELRALASVSLINANGLRELSLASEMPNDETAVGRVTVQSGRRPTSANEAVVEPGMAKVGETVKVRFKEQTHSFDVVGVGLDLAACGAPTCRPGRILLSSSGFQLLVGPIAGSQASVSLTLKDPSTAQRFGMELVDGNPQIFRSFTWDATRSQYLAPDDLLGGFVTALGGFVLVAAVVVLGGTIRAQMVSRQREFALLTVLGASPGLVGVSLVVEYLVLAAIGSVFGWVLGTLVSPIARAATARTIGWGRPEFELRSLLIVLTVVCLLVSLTVLGSALRAARTPLVASLRNETLRGRPRLRSALRLPGTTLPLGVQDPFTRPVRSFAALCGFVLALSGAIMTLSFSHTANAMTSRDNHPGDLWDATAWSMSAVSTTELGKSVDSLPEVLATYTVKRHDVSLIQPGKADRVLTAGAIGGPYAARSVAIIDGHALQAADEVLAARGFLRDNNLHLGDSLTVTVQNRPIKLRIVGTFRDMAGGVTLRYRLERLQLIDRATNPGSLHVIARPGVDRPTLALAIQNKIGDLGQVFAAKGVWDAVQNLQLALRAILAVILVVGLAQLGASILVGAREQQRDTAMLAAIGFTPSQLRMRAGIGAALLAAVSVVLGVPLGRWLGKFFGARAVARVGLDRDVILGPTPAALTLLILGVIAVAMITGIGAAHRSGVTSPSTHIRTD